MSRFPQLMRWVVVAIVGASLASQAAAPKTIAVASGDCKNPELLTGMTTFEKALKERLKTELVDSDTVMSKVRPRPGRSLDDIKRQYKQALSHYYNSQYERTREILRHLLAELNKVSVELKPWPTTAECLVLLALVERELNHRKDAEEAFRRILRIQPTYQLDTDVVFPSGVQAFESFRKELAREKKGVLSVQAPTPSQVYVDGTLMGSTPARIELIKGTYTVVLAHGDEISFAHSVTIEDPKKEAQLAVEMPFEGSLSTQLPLCLTGKAEAGFPAKLAAIAGADRLVVFSLESLRGDPPNYQAALYTDGRRERMASIVPPRRDSQVLAHLADFISTGQPLPGIEALEGVKPGAHPVVAENPPPVKPNTDEPGVLPPPPPPPASAVSGKLSTGRKVGIGLLVGGAVVAGLGFVFTGAAASNEKGLQNFIGPEGKLPPTGSTGHRYSLDLMITVDELRLASALLLGVGGGTLLAGLLSVALFPVDAPVRLSVAPAPGGGVVSLAGVF